MSAKGDDASILHDGQLSSDFKSDPRGPFDSHFGTFTTGRQQRVTNASNISL